MKNKKRKRNKKKTVAEWARIWDCPIWLAHKSLRKLCDIGEAEEFYKKQDGRVVLAYRIYPNRSHLV